MKLIVNAHNIELIKEETVNEKEINISKCTFEFSDEYGDNLVKEAYFTLDGETYKQIIVNNECSYPPEVLVKTGTVELGVVAYEVQDDEYIERFNPSPVYFQTVIGSLKDHAENSQEITPSEMEQFEQALEEGLAEVQNVDIDASKTGNTATVSITNRNGETKTVEIYDGEKGEDGEPGITPNIQVGDTTTLPAGSNATVTQRGTTENPIFDFGIPKGQDGSGGGTNDYTQLSNKPKINNVELNGNKTTSDLGINIPDVSNFITKDVDDLTNYYQKTETYNKTEIDNKVSSVYRYRGTVQTYSELPSTDLVIGDVYNIEQADSQHGIEAGDNVAWTGTTWDKLSGNVDLSGYQPLLVSGTNIKTINNTSILGSGNINTTAKCYIDENYVVCNLSPGHYNITTESTSWVSNIPLPTTELKEAFELAYANNKYLLINIPTSTVSQTATFITSETIRNQIGSTILFNGVVHVSTGNIRSIALNIGYNNNDGTITISTIKVKTNGLYAIGTGNTSTFTPTQATHPATKGYVDDATSTLRQKVEVITSSDTSYTIANLTANKSYKLGELTDLTITACETFDEESVIYFDSGSTATVLTLPNDVITIGDEIEANKSYILSILNKIAVIKGYEVE